MKYFNLAIMIIAVVVFVFTVQKINFSDLSFETNYRNYLRLVISIAIFLIYLGKVLNKKNH